MPSGRGTRRGAEMLRCLNEVLRCLGKETLANKYDLTF